MFPDDPAVPATAAATLPGGPPPAPDRCGELLTEASLRGEVVDAVFRSDDGHFAVLKVRAADGAERVLVGELGDLRPGQELEAWGQWQTHPQYGRRLQVRRCRPLLPSTAEGLVRFLGSGIVRGLGPKLAQRIVDRFGTDTLHVIDHTSERLLEVPGFGKQKLAALRQVWQQKQAERDTLVFLQGLGLGLSVCRRIAQRFGAQTVDAVRGNPYLLAREVRGIGFKTADGIGRALGLPAEHPARLEAGTSFLLSQLCENEGHCCQPAGPFLQRAAESLAVSVEAAGRGVALATEHGNVQTREWGSERWLYPLELETAEAALARQLRALLAAPPPPARIPRLPGSERLNPAQRRAVVTAFEAPVSVITGGPGVGKTTVTREIVAGAKALGWRVLLAAPTGRAARRLADSTGERAQTLHRLLRWEAERGGFHHDERHPLEADLLIVDEVSMLDAKLGASLFRALAPGVRLVLVGDRDQLPSVGPGAVLRDLIASEQVPVTCLTEIFRQASGSRIILAAHAVNAGRSPLRHAGDSAELSDFYWVPQEDPERVAELLLRLAGERIPERFGLDPGEDVQVLTPMNRGPCGTVDLNQRLQQQLAGPAPLVNVGPAQYREGDRVMQIVNNYDLQVFNGDLGRVLQIDPGRRKLIVSYDTGDVTYPFEDAEQLRLAYAVTIHKSQGSEFPAVLVPLLTQHYIMLQRNLLYTAMTRARRLLVLVGNERALRLAVDNRNEMPRFTGLVPRLLSPNP